MSGKTKALVLAIIIVVVFMAMCSYSASKQDTNTQNKANSKSNEDKWYSGGTLHKATVEEWNKAIYRNKLATVGDWLYMLKWKNRKLTEEDSMIIKEKAQIVVKYLDELANDEATPKNLKVAELAYYMIKMSNDLGPEE